MSDAREFSKKTIASILALLLVGLISSHAMAAEFITLTIKNGGSEPLTIKRMERAYCSWNEYNEPVGQIWPNIKPGKSVDIKVTRVDGHDCDGENGAIEFLFTPPGIEAGADFSSQVFQFTSGFDLWRWEQQPNPYPGKLKEIATGKYTYTTPASNPIHVVGKPIAKWEHLCPPGGRQCKLEVKEFVTKGSSEGTKISRSETEALTVSLSAGIEFKGASAGADRETLNSQTRESAISTLNSVTTGHERKEFINIPYKKGKLGVVWRWTITSTMSDGQVIVLKSLARACTAYDHSPDFLPGSKEAIDSCQT